MAGYRDENTIWIARVDRDLRNLLAVAQTQMRPGFSRVRRFVDTITHRKIGTLQAFAATYVDNVCI